MEVFAGDEGKFRLACKNLGLSNNLVKSLLERLKRLNGAEVEIDDDISDKALAAQKGRKIQLALSYLDDFAMARSSGWSSTGKARVII